jgi:hypothetical protein
MPSFQEIKIWRLVRTDGTFQCDFFQWLRSTSYQLGGTDI